MLDDLGVCVCACGATLSLFLAAALQLTGQSLCSMFCVKTQMAGRAKS
jgi:hypothetical protein